MSVIATKGLAEMPAGQAGSVDAPRLSTDFLNHYSEALMLIEMAGADESFVADLQSWQSRSYREHFRASPLRCAASALAAYDRVDPARARTFEDVCLAMTRLVQTVTALLAEVPQPKELPMIVAVASDALRSQIGRATQFINANGTVDIAAVGDAALQAQIDALLAR